MSFWVPTFALLPMVNLAARAQQPILVWTGLGLFMIVGSFAGMCQVCNILMTNNAAPRPELLGTLNGLSQMVASVVGVVAPIRSSHSA
ncbi:LOW QUALITY PROTEIN: hypothetical protein JCM24511_10006 [Saitozyma sp. JCM 24511]|nr:LOW QUALITY PROTEIN: hypothetical protein JCM24511_10006 [Saitozyma sp. JCM 24511]